MHYLLESLNPKILIEDESQMLKKQVQKHY